jgi:hypothetical protein
MEGINVIDKVFSVNYMVGGDLYAGYEMNLFQLMPDVSAGLTVLEPTFFGELGFHCYAEVNFFNYVKPKIRLSIEAMRLNFLNLELVWDIGAPDKVIM